MCDRFEVSIILSFVGTSFSLGLYLIVVGSILIVLFLFLIKELTTGLSD